MKTILYYLAQVLLALCLLTAAAESISSEQEQTPAPSTEELQIIVAGDIAYMSLDTFKKIQSTLLGLTESLNRYGFILKNNLNCAAPSEEKQLSPQPKRSPQNLLPPL